MFILTKIEAQFFWNQRSLILVFSHSYPRFPCCQPRVFVALVGSCGFPTNIPSVNPTVKSDFFRFTGRPRLDYSNPKDSGWSENLGGTNPSPARWIIILLMNSLLKTGGIAYFQTHPISRTPIFSVHSGTFTQLLVVTRWNLARWDCRHAGTTRSSELAGESRWDMATGWIFPGWARWTGGVFK